ncbi:flagellin [Desulfovibrio sp. ZJ369]|uniref:flagellin N-terminal helical domain-containing protein n=1 Tax=Desulfovibrio sp. ZJ369 TaxID=2709793 RepID=UPI0013EB8F65|nr:flagellin [Desulfovibrio sp. ZJ369]
MSLVINHNMMAANTARNLNSHYAQLSKSTQRLSTGLRVNSAADDAAGLAIRELQRADIATLQQGARNANDAISLIQTADGALSIIDEKLVRMKELAEQAATGTYDSTQRLMIESEYQAMASEITRIANATDFNGIKLLDGTLSSNTHDGSGLTATGKLKVHFGTGNDSAEDYYYIKIGQSTASALGVGNQAIDSKGELRAGGTISTQEAAQKSLEALTQAIVSKDKIRAHLGAMQNRLENTITNLNTQAENLQAAESRISDVDVATEMTQFVRTQILSQSAVAMLSQANSLPKMAMQLIGG